jgi:phosphate/sulfate permease
MNSSLWSADRTVHIKIVLVSLAAAIVILAFGINARLEESNSATVVASVNGSVLRAGQPTKVSANDLSRIR